MTATDADVHAPPRWDLTPFFPSLDSREFAAAHESFGAGVQRLQALYDRHGVRADATAPADAATVAAFEEVVDATNALLDELRLVNAYVHGFVTTDARDDRALGLASRLRADAAPLAPLTGRFDAWVASIGADALMAASPLAVGHAHRLHKAERSARHQMSESEEALAAELNLTGASAWYQLWGEVTARLTASVAFPDGTTQRLPMTVVCNLATDPSAAVRRAAYEAEVEAWDGVGVVCAAAMNGIKGETIVVNRRREWGHSVDPSLHANNVDRATLDAMQSAVVASLPDFQRYLRSKARLLDSAGPDGGLPWWDLTAPVAEPSVAAVPWDEACAMVQDAFASFSPALAALAERALRERWVDAEARDGKRGGAFCMPVRGGESRILMSFCDSFDSVSTLAHELGHAYHNVTLAERTPMQRVLPMALAETASIFCETVLVQAGLAGAAGADPARRLALLDTDLTGAAQVVVDIHSRFLFEQSVFERRRDRALSVAELCELMTDAQSEAYGDGLDASSLHRYMWAVKPHYYSTSYYNWPYTFGLLFGIGLYARYTEDADRFRQGYDDLLSSTGMDDAAELAARFDIDIRDERFWTSSLDVLRRRIDEFELLATSQSVDPTR